MNGIAVDGRIERRIVVHFQLPIEFESPRSGERFAPQGVEAGGQIAALFFQNR
jgi:hypothetical protein